jgi:hypothetical protein
MEKSDRIIQIKHEFEFGESGINKEIDSALFRPLRVLTNEGKPIGHYQYLFFHNKQRIHNCKSNFLVLGSFVYSTGKQILFFPGILGRHFTIYNSDGTIERKEENLNKIDHISLEPSQKRWHVTYYDEEVNKKHEQRFPVNKIDEQITHWFSMSIKDINKFEILKGKNEISFQCSENDSKRRLNEHTNAIKNAIHNIIEILDARSVVDPSFIHFDFFVREKKDEKYSVPGVCFARQSLLGDQYLLPNGPVPVRTHRIQLEGFTGDIIISGTLMSGPLSDDVILTFANKSHKNKKITNSL